MTFTECRQAWRKDWIAMQDGSYVAPLPHPKLFDWAHPNNIEAGRKTAVKRWGNRKALNGCAKTEE